MSNYEKISTINMTHEDWLKERRHSIGGSDVGALLGLNRYRSPYTVWAEKIGLLPEQMTLPLNGVMAVCMYRRVR